LYSPSMVRDTKWSQCNVTLTRAGKLWQPLPCSVSCDSRCGKRRSWSKLDQGYVNSCAAQSNIIGAPASCSSHCVTQHAQHALACTEFQLSRQVCSMRWCRQLVIDQTWSVTPSGHSAMSHSNSQTCFGNHFLAPCRVTHGAARGTVVLEQAPAGVFEPLCCTNKHHRCDNPLIKSAYNAACTARTCTEFELYQRDFCLRWCEQLCIHQAWPVTPSGHSAMSH